MRTRSTSLLTATAFILSGTALTRAADSAGDLLKQGDVFEKKLDAVHALPLYQSAEKLEPENAEVQVRISQAFRYLLADASSKTEKIRLGHIALAHAEKAAALAPNDPEAQIAVGITYGKMLPYLPTKEQVEATPRIKASVDRTLALNPRSDTAWHILGRWNRVLADVNSVKRALAGVIYGKLPKGSNEEAARCLEKAVSINPSRLMHYIELGRVYAQMGRSDEARRCINKGLAMPDAEKDDPEAKERGREALKTIH
jgi:tetratricopeptide (TPR) repeat protein